MFTAPLPTHQSTLSPNHRSPIVSYPQAYLSHLERWLTEWRIAIKVSKSTVIIFARAGRRFIQPQSVTLFGERINWVDKGRYLGVILDKKRDWQIHRIGWQWSSGDSDLRDNWLFD